MGDRIEQARDSYQEAWNKLCRNKGNVIRQAEMLKDLGVSPTKSLPASSGTPDGDDLSDGQGVESPALQEGARAGRRGRPRKTALAPAASDEEESPPEGLAEPSGNQ